MSWLKKILLKFLLTNDQFQILEKGYSVKDRDNIKDWLMNTLPTIVKDFRDNNKGYPKSISQEGNNSITFRDRWVEVLDKIANYMNEANPNKCHWQNRFKKGTKRYLVEQEKINSYRIKCLHKSLRILDFYIEDMHN